jgi:hypothetical protein
MSPKDPMLDPMLDDASRVRDASVRPAAPSALDPRFDAGPDAARGSSYRPRRARWPGLLAAGVVGAAIGGVVLVNLLDEPPATTPTVAQEMRTTPPAVAPADRPTAAAPDAAITAAVKAALAADPTLAPQPIDVQTQNGVVTLTGPASDEPSRERAEVLASASEGVQRVENRLVVTTSKGA